MPALDGGALVDLGSVRQKSGKMVEAWAAEGEFDPAALGQQHDSRWSGRRAAAASASSPRSTGPSGSTPRRRGAKILAAQAELLDRLLEQLAGEQLSATYTRRGMENGSSPPSASC